MTPQALKTNQAIDIALKTIESARKNDFKPMAVCVLDAAGTIKAQITEDGASLLRPDIAYAKAWSCLGMGHSTRGQAAFAGKMPSLYQAFSGISNDRLVPAPGGVFIVHDGVQIGSVGVSGDMPDADETCAVAGIEAAGLAADI